MSKRQEIRQQRARQQQRQKLYLILAITGFAILLAALLIVPNLINAQQEAQSFPLAEGSTMGDPNAPVKVVEFSDYQCSHCRDFAIESQPRLVSEYIATGKVHFTYVPFSFMGPDSSAAAAATYCAMDQGKFWQYHEMVFRNVGTSAGALSQSSLLQYGSQLGLDQNQFRECVTSGKYDQKVVDDLNYGAGQGVEATPSFLVNDKLVFQGELFQTIDEALASAD